MMLSGVHFSSIKQGSCYAAEKAWSMSDLREPQFFALEGGPFNNDSLPRQYPTVTLHLKPIGCR